jgi:cysteine desulfurase
MKKAQTIYLDHQATTPVDSRVFAEMAPFFHESFGNPHSSDHYLGWEAADAGARAATQVAELLGAAADEIVFTSGATEANNLALLGIGRRAAGGKRRRILVGAIEHKCVLAVTEVLKGQLGYEINYLPVDREGRLVLSALSECLEEDVLLVSVMSVNNEIGTIQDMQAISEQVRRYGAIFHSDCAQAPCAMSLEGLAERVDMMSLSAHKMYGPKGIGALYIRRDLQDQIEPLMYGGGQQRNLRSGTLPIPLCVGMGAASALLISGDAAEERESLRVSRDNFVHKLMALPWPVSINGSTRDRHPGNANLRFGGFSAHEIINALQPNVAASTGSACTSGNLEPSYVLRAIGLSAHEADESIRFSVGRHTTEAELDEAVDLVDKVLSRLATLT